MSGIETFDEIAYSVTSIRKKGWPGLTRTQLLYPSPEVPVIVTNSKNLNDVLDLGYKWYETMRMLLTTASPEVFERWPFEASFYKKAVQHYNEVDVRQLVG